MLYLLSLFFPTTLSRWGTITIFGELFALEALMKSFIKSMSKEDKQKMMQQFMNSMTEEERTEMMQLMMPILMKNMKPSMMMPDMMKNFDEDECKKMMMEMEPEMREKCRKMMTACLKDSE
jgi:alpha-galactosidase/6-phospho-beta-glucosidase family protein